MSKKAKKEPDYVPYGDDWRRAVMALTKEQIVEILRLECISGREHDKPVENHFVA